MHIYIHKYTTMSGESEENGIKMIKLDQGVGGEENKFF